MFISIVVCTYNRSSSLIRSLGSIADSLSRAVVDRSEIVVVNNASTDDTAEAVAKWIQQNPDIDLRLVYEAEQGIASARNRCHKEAKGDLIITVDDDCMMDENYIQNCLSYYEDDKEPVLRFGRLLLGDPRDWPMTIQESPYKAQWKKDPAYETINIRNIFGANMMVPRAIIEAVGPYDKRFGTKLIPGGEDADFGFRVYNHGFLLEYVPDVIAKHYHGRDNAEAVEKLVRGYMISAGALYAKHLFRHPHVQRRFSSMRLSPLYKNQLPPSSDDPRSGQISAYYNQGARTYYFKGVLRFFLSRLRTL